VSRCRQHAGVGGHAATHLERGALVLLEAFRRDRLAERFAGTLG